MHPLVLASMALGLTAAVVPTSSRYTTEPSRPFEGAPEAGCQCLEVNVRSSDVLADGVSPKIEACSTEL